MSDRPYQHHSEAELLDLRQSLEGSLRQVKREETRYIEEAGSRAYAQGGSSQFDQRARNISDGLTAINQELIARRAERSTQPTATGTVKWFSAQKGYGFIVPDGGGKDLFVHFSAIQGSGYRALAEGSRVRYSVEQSVKGLHAVNVWPC